jgi:hypothetical protein
VSITRLRVRRWLYLPQFLIQSFRAARQARRAAGNLAVSVLREADRAFWTRTVRRDEAAMRSFMQSDVHRRILARLPVWCDEAALVHILAGGPSALATGGPAFEGQSPVGSPTPVRDPRAADERRSGVQVIAGSPPQAGRAGCLPQRAEFPI